jgi:hypothetical protein
MNNLFYNAAVAGGLLWPKKQQNLRGQEKRSLS